MFDVSFVELMLIGVVALIVLGPEKLPTAARTVGRFVRRARSSWNSVRSEFEREFAAEELKRSMREAAASVDVTRDFRKAAEDLRREVEDPMLGRAERTAIGRSASDAAIDDAVADARVIESEPAPVDTTLPPGDSSHDTDYKPHG